MRDQDLAEVRAELDTYQPFRSLSEEWIDLGIERAQLRRQLRKQSTGKIPRKSAKVGFCPEIDAA